MNFILNRDATGRAILWRCTNCGEAFTLGWGSECNKCIRQQEQHRELIATIRAAQEVKKP